MEKLIELLNEFDKLENPFTHYKKGWYGDCAYEDYLPSISHLILISKSYGFIWWLVENNKIDRDKSETITAKTEIMLATNYNNGVEVRKRYWVYEQLLMILSIQDNPIEFLISILK